ncbi:GPI anchored protein [Penicillium argentinense]|uniref:GPI anchored protein n=1 Tax=Penicillium argentinense TaxID=1131581 RepID=A0A9W9G0V1_9EURO|nr:GPI anchored protein [Penicillium argentinense]KAJ5110066.1 GPI anchored protein [Penicillium argentinense]
MKGNSILLLLVMAIFVMGHFHLLYPISRGDNVDKMNTFPCGGLSESTNRTKLPYGNFPVSVRLGHSSSAMEVLISLDYPEDAFPIISTFGVKGQGQFCLPDVEFDPRKMGIDKESVNATIMVQTNGDPDGGLYACADVEFAKDTKVMGADCRNNTKFEIVTFKGEGEKLHANESTPDGYKQTHDNKNDAGKTDLLNWGISYILVLAWYFCM